MREGSSTLEYGRFRLDMEKTSTHGESFASNSQMLIFVLEFIDLFCSRTLPDQLKS